MLKSILSSALGNPEVQRFLTEQKLLLPTVLLETIAKRSLKESKVQLLQWTSKEDAIYLKMDLSQVDSMIKLHEAEVAIEVVSITVDSNQQMMLMRPRLIGAKADGVLTKIVLWVASTLMQALVQSLLEKSLTIQTANSPIKITSTAEGMLVDFSEVPEICALRESRPIPLINQKIFDMIQICGGNHASSGFVVHGKVSLPERKS